VPADLSEGGGLFGGTPSGLRVNAGPTVAGVPGVDRESQVRELLTVHDPGAIDPVGDGAGSGLSLGSMGGIDAAAARRRYVEARIGLGDAVTVIGWAIPFGTLDDPNAADAYGGADAAIANDPAIAADLEAARRDGLLAGSPEEAWGNAAIPGFGIGRPVSTPDLDPGATPLPLGDAEQTREAARRFEIPDEELVVAVTPGQPLAVFDGEPGVAAGREQARFLTGLGGAVLAIVSALALAYVLRGGPFP
jgi:hypothetical protein